jgi:nitroreductase
VRSIVEGARVDDRDRRDTVLDAIRNRRSVGKVRQDAVPQELIETVIDAATWAPNHRLTQPWRFFVLTGAARAAMGDAIAARLEADGGVTAGALEAARSKLLRAPVVVVVAQVERPADAEKDLEDYAACACAVQNLMLAAHEAGLASKWSTGAMAGYPGAKAFLGLAPTDRIVAYVYLGYADTPPVGTSRRPAAEVTHWLGW